MKNKTRNEQIAELLASGEKIKDFYRFAAQNTHMDLHDACQIVLARPKASICFYIDEWNEMGRRVTKDRKGIPFYDTDGNKQIVFDLHDTHGDKRYRRLIFPMRKLLYGLDELNDTELAESNRSDYSKILSGVAKYLDENGYFTEDARRNSIIAEGVAYSLYSKTGFPKDNNISLRGMPYSLSENARLFKEIYLLTDAVREDISVAYEIWKATPQVIDDIEEEVVSDEPVPVKEHEKPVISEMPTVEEPTTSEPNQAVQLSESEEESASHEERINPMYSRYMTVQQERPEAVVLNRSGDFYEVYGERAKAVSEWLDITLTGRDMGLSDRVPMCGFPCVIADKYIEKILEHCGVAVLETDAEPIYIHSHEEANASEKELESDEPSEITFDADELAELNSLLTEEYPNETKQVSDALSEENLKDVDAEEYFDESEEIEVEGAKLTSQFERPKEGKAKTDEKRIRDRKRNEKPQMSLFDLLAGPKEQSREEQLIENQLLRGSGFTDGKYRIYEKYFTNPTVKEYASFLKSEYGIGGYSDGHNSQDHDGKGIRMEWSDRDHPEHNIQIDLKWNEVAIRIADLIDEDKYLTAEEKSDYEKRYKPEQAEQRRQRESEQKKKDEFVYLVIQHTNPVRKQRILEGYGKIREGVEFAKFLSEEYGYSTEATSGYLARYDANGVWLSKYDRNGNTELHLNLSWNDFACKVCDLIKDDRLFSDDNKARLEQIADDMVKSGTERTADGRYAYFFSTFRGEESFVKAHYKELSDLLNTRAEIKDVTRDDWYIHVTYYKEYCTKLQGTEEAIQEHNERVSVITERIVRDGTQNSTEGNWINYFDEFGKDSAFVQRNAEEIAAELERHREVSDVELLPDAIDTNFYLDYCPNYVSQESEDGYEEEQNSAEVEQISSNTDHPINQFTELSAEDKAFFETYMQMPNRRPITSPWDTVQACTVIAPGIYSVDTEGHGGIMISKALAPYILSPEALAEGFVEKGYYCYEEDAAQSIPLRELYDKGILDKTNVYFTQLEYWSTDPESEREYVRFTELTAEEQEGKIKAWNDAVNESLAHWYPEYWEAYQRASRMSENSAKNTDLNAVLDQSELGGAKSRFKGNMDAIRLMKRLYFENRDATAEERKVLAKYVGWGGLAQAFDETNKQWSKEYAELQDVLTVEQYEKAKGSVLNAHYTSKEVIGGIYAALKRFGVKGNNRILEPAMGTGNFFGYMPQAIADGANLYGVELDEVTGKIASKLYPQAKVQIKGFEETSFPQDYFDVVVGNVPFGGYSVYDSEYSRQKFMIHDYFIAKSIDRVKPNGIVAVVTSKGTLDKLNPVARKYMAERAELLGAIRLPNNAFKQTANTEAVTDILFFQKRAEKLSETSNIEWLGTGKTEDGFEVNNYFIAHPEMVLGTFAKETGLYGAEGLTVKPDGRDLGEALVAAVNNLPQNIYESPDHSSTDTEGQAETDVFAVRPMCYIAVNGKIYMRVGEELKQQEIPAFPKDAYERIAGMIALRDELRYVLDIQSDGCTDEVLNREQRKLESNYDRFVRKYGIINSQTNVRLFREDGDAALLFACEVLSEDKTRATKADIFTKRTIRPYSTPIHTNDTLEALQICRNERGGVDLSFIEELTGKDFDTVLFELGETVYRDPISVKEGDKYSGYQTAEDYLSGKVVEKLRIAREYAEKDSQYTRNVTALEKVQPEPLKANEISVRIGASWVKPEYYKQFLMRLLDIYRFYEDDLKVRYNSFDSSWKVDRADHVRKNAGMNATEKYGTSRANAFRLFEDCLNQRATTIYDTVEEDGKEKRVLNQAETIAAREKQNKIKEAFADWIYADPNRREDLEKTYNSLFNQIRLPSYDGSYLKFPGMNPAIELRPHQKNAIARIAGTGNSTLLHHVVGSGKSYTMAASAMKLRQYGLAKKPMIVVPNHLVQQMANEFRTLYPTAKLLIATKDDLEKNKRKQFVSKVAMGDWDSVIIAQSSFAKIPVSRERQERLMRDEIAKIEAAILEMRKDSGARTAVKNLERIKKGRETMLKKLTDSSKKDDVLIFENLGVDYLFVDEADAYKNKFLYTKMNNVSGISNAASARASDMQMKIEYINELHGGDKGVVFATGTPISNSMAEMYIMQTYLQRNTLEELGIGYFDSWAADFGETVTALEMAPSGQGYRARTRFAKFTNLPELMTLYRSFADVQTADMVKLDVPETERVTVTLEPSEQTLQIAEEIAKRAEAIYNGGVDPHEDNMLKVTSDGKKLALDVRCFDPFLKDEGMGKLDECADNAVEVYEETKAIRGTQLIFCDMSTPKKPYESYEYGKDFDVYNDLKHKLIERGIPAEEVAFIHDAKTDKEKQTLFDKMNEGRIRILIGSTEKCGAGTNVQKRLAALHHLDAPYRPRDLQQRDGRGIRQHNMNKSVKIFTYVKKRTLDSYCYQILENKQRFISQIENGSLTVREAEDIDETTLSYAEIKAITAANPKIKRKVELETELTRLRVLEGEYRKNTYILQDKTLKELPTQIHAQEKLLQYVQEDKQNMRGKYNSEVFTINVLGKIYTDKKEGATALVEALRSNKYDTPVAEYGGFRISLNPPTYMSDTRCVALTYRGSYNMEIGDSELGLITRLDNFMRDFPEKENKFSAKLEQLKRDLAVAEAELKKPFEHKSEIEAVMRELSEINAELDLNKHEEVVIETGEENDDEEVNYMALPEKEADKTEPVKRQHKRMTEKQYKQYMEYKTKFSGAVIFLKNGDFYEMVGGDAEIATNVCGAAIYEKELGGEKRTVAMLTYDNLDAMVNVLAKENRPFKIVEQENEIDRDIDFLETEEETRAIERTEEEEKAHYSIEKEVDGGYTVYYIGDGYRIEAGVETYSTIEEARDAARTLGIEPSEWERVEVSIQELQKYASDMGDNAKLPVAVLPDYFVTQEEMHEYGYLWNGMLPLTKSAAQYNFQDCLLLYEDDTEGYGETERRIEDHGGLFGVERFGWKRFIESEDGKAYLAARLFVSTAVMKMVGEELSDMDEREQGEHKKFVSRLKEENIALSNYFKDKWFPLPETMEPYVENIVNEYIDRLNGVYNTEARGKHYAEIKSEITARIGLSEMLFKQDKATTKEELFEGNRKYLEQHKEVPCYVIEHNEKTGKYYGRTIGGYEILVRSRAYDDEQSCRADLPSGVELANVEELAGISRMRCKIYPDYFVTVSEKGQYYPLSKRKAQQLMNLGLPICVFNGKEEYVSITDPATMDNTEKGFYIGKAEWYGFTRTNEGKAYLYARLLTAKAAQAVLSNDLDYAGFYSDNFSEVIYAEEQDLENSFAGEEEPSEEAVKPYLYGLCREYASRLDGNGNLRAYGWWYEDIVKAIVRNLPEQFSENAEQIAAAETEVLKPEKTFYSVVENEGEWRLYGIDNYEAKVTYVKFQTEEKKDKYISDMLSANSGLQFEEVPYEKLKEIADDLKTKREAYIAQDREVFLKKRQEENQAKRISYREVEIFPDYTIRDDGSLSVDYIKENIYKVRRQTAEVLRGLLPVYNIAPDGSERRIDAEDNLLMGKWNLGIKEADWKEFIESDKSRAYLCARFFVADATLLAVRSDANTGDVQEKPFTVGAEAVLDAENGLLYSYLEENGTPPAGAMQPYVDGIMAEYMSRIVLQTPYLKENPDLNNHGEAFRWEMVRKLQREGTRETQYEKLMADMKSISDYVAGDYVFYTLAWDREEKKYFTYTAIGYSELKKGSEGYETLGECRRSVKNGIELPHMQALVEMSWHQFYILPEYGISYEYMAQYGFRDISVCPLTRRRAQQLCNLGVTVYALGENNEKKQVDITEITGGRMYGVEKDEWRRFTKTDRGMEYLYARKAAANAALKAGADVFSQSAENDYGDIFETLGKECGALNSFLNEEREPDSEILRLYVPEIVKEYAAKYGKELPDGMTYFDVEDTIADYLPDTLKAMTEEYFRTEREKYRARPVYYTKEARGDSYVIYYVDAYRDLVESEYADKADAEHDLEGWSTILNRPFREIPLHELQNYQAKEKEAYKEMLASAPEAFKDVSTLLAPSAVRPDYWISDDEMKEYGYRREGMIPVWERAANYLAKRFYLPVYKLGQDNTAIQTKNVSEIDAFGGMFGIKKEDWNAFLNTNKGQEYFGAVYFAASAAVKALNESMGNVDARIVDPLSDKLFKDKNEIYRYLLSAGIPDTDAVKPYIRDVVKEYAYWLNVKVPFDYGWDTDSIEQAICEQIEQTELKKYLNRSESVRYYGRDTENIAYASVQGELNDDTFAIIAENGRGADSFIIAAQSTVFDTAAQNSRGIFFMGIGKEISEADISDEESVIEKMQTAADRLAAERTMRSVEKYEQVRDSVLSEFAEFEANAEEELPYKERFYKAITDYFARGGGNLLDEAQIEKLTGDKGNILARLYDYDWDGVAHGLSDDAEITVLIEYYNENKESENAGTADKDYAAIVRERVEKAYESYKETHPDHANNLGRNLFYRNMYEYLQFTDTLPYAYFIAMEKDGDEVMSRLCEYYEQNGDLALHTYRERQEIVEQYAEKYYPEILREAKLPKYYGKGADGTAYYYLPQGLSDNALTEIKVKASEYTIAAPQSTLSIDRAEECHVTFLKTEKDIPDAALYGTAASAKHEMRRAAEKIKHDAKNLEQVTKNVRTALENLQSDQSIKRAGYKERFFAAFTEFIEDSDDYYLSAEDIAELIKDGDAVTERVYAYYMETSDPINTEAWDELSELTKNYIDDRWKKQETMTKEVSVYGETLEYANLNGEQELYRNSLRANIECKRAIEESIRNNFDGMHLNKDFENELIERFGMERVKYVLANTVQENEWDGRYSPETKQWAKAVAVTEKKDHRSQFIVGSHPAVLDGFISRLRKAEKIESEEKQGKGGEVQGGKYRTETKKGFPVLQIEKDKYGHDIAIVKRKDDFVVAIGYDVNDGTWAQGRYDFPTREKAQEYIDEKYKARSEEKSQWITAKVSRDALIRRYEKHSFFRMPNGEYEDYTYNVFNNRVKDSRQLADLQSDGHELCYELVFPADGEITIKTSDGDEVVFTTEEFAEYIGGTTNADYEREEREDDTTWYAISVPQEAHRGTYEKSSLFSMPVKSEFAGYSYYIPNVFVEEDKRGEDGNILITLPENFHVTLRNRATDEEMEITPFDLYTECNGTKGEEYAPKQSETEGNAEKKKQVQVVIPVDAKIAKYKTQTLFKMPYTSKFDGYCFYLFNDQLRPTDINIGVSLSENFIVQLKDKKNDRHTTLTAEEFKTIMDAASAEDFAGELKKPSKAKEDLFNDREKMLRKNIPSEMLLRPNWVAVKVFRDQKKDKIIKLQKDPKTGEAASPLDPSTWSDFDTACKFAHENGCVSLAYALDGKDNICCIDIDHCINAKREMSELAKTVWNSCGNTYREVSVSREGLHVFGKTNGLDLQVFSDAGDMEFYERGKFMTVTGDAFGETKKNLFYFDELLVKDLLTKKFSKHKTYSWVGKGIEGLSSMSDREVLEKAFASKDGATFKALFNGEDLKNNHSNSDMALMVRLAFWCNGDKDQMLRIFAASGLYRPDKSPEYFEYTALKAVRENPNRYEPKQFAKPNPSSARKSDGNSK